jgi:sodium transport system permease protein
VNLRTVNTILSKELLDTLRDKRTLIMMVGMPVVLYPALLIVGMQAMLLQHEKLDETISRVALVAPESTLLESWFDAYEKIEVVESDDPDVDLANRELDAIVIVEDDMEATLARGGTLPIEVQFDSTELESNDAVGRVRNALDEVFGELQEARLAEKGIQSAYVNPLEVTENNVAPASKTTGTAMGMLLPFIMVIMIALGAFYPAVDLTAGEKERGTFESLLSTPTSKFEIVTGKFLTVFILAMVTGILNLGSMGVTFIFMLDQLSGAVENQLNFDLSLPWYAFVIILIVMVPLAFFVSALMMSIAVMARSFKEAQNYVTPFFLVIMMPSLLAIMPGRELGPVGQFVPIYNVVLLFKELMTEKAGLETVFVVFLSTAAFAVLALQLAAWLFQREEVVLSEERGIPLTWRRSEFRERDALPPGMTLGWFTLMLVVLFYAGSVVQGWDILWGLAITEWLLLLAPSLLLLWYVRVDVKKALLLVAPSPVYVLGGVLVGLSAMVLLIEFGTWHQKVLPVPKELEEALVGLLSGGESWSGLAVLILVIAVGPAICEEVLFRGVILSGFRQRMGTWPVIILVGVLFGLFHISIYRIVPTGLLGIVLTYLVVRSGSIWIGVLVHFLNNGLAVLVATEHVPTELITVLEKAGDEGLPMTWLLPAVAAFVVGVVLIEWRHRRQG